MDVNKDLENNGGIFQLLVTDILKDMQYNSCHRSIKKEAFSIKDHVIINLETRRLPIIKVSYFKSFGSDVTRERRNRVGAVMNVTGSGKIRWM